MTPRRFGNKSHISVEQFVEFLNNNQRDPRLNEILYPYANPDRARDLFQQFESLDSNKGSPRRNSKRDLLTYGKELVFMTQISSRRVLVRREIHGDAVRRRAECLSAEGFLRFLLSEDNSIVSADKFDLSHDMEQPLCHYFVNSSHNTYLTGKPLI